MSFDLRKILFLVVGVLIVLTLAYVASSDRGKIKTRPILHMLVIELVLAWALYQPK